MPTATQNTTLTRRCALRFSATALLAGLTTPAIAGDAEIIQVCGQLLTIRQQIMALHEERTTIEEEERTEPELAVLNATQESLVDRLERLGQPTTMGGAIAIARAALACWDHTNGDNEPIPECDGTWMALNCVEWLVSRGTA